MKRWRRLLVPLTVAMAGAVLALAAGAWQQAANRRIADERLEPQAERMARQVTRRLQSYEYGLRGLRGAHVVAAGPGLTRELMRAYSATRQIAEEFPGARGFGLIWRVPKAKEADFVAAARQDGWPEFKVRQLSPHDGERFVITYIEPVAPNASAVGLDIASEARRKAAALAAARDGRATLTAPITLVQTASKVSWGFLLLLPIYAQGMPLATAEQREAACVGWSYAPLVIDEVLATVADTYEGDMRLALRDAAEPAAFFQMPVPEARQGATLPRKVISLPLFGREWQADVVATPAFVERLHLVSPLTIGASVLAGTWLLALASHALLLSAERRRQARLEQARRAAIVDASHDAVISETLDGRVIDWNEGAVQLFGHYAEEAVGEMAARLLLPPERAGEDADLRQHIARGERVPPFETTRRHRDGRLLDVSVSASPLRDEQGRIVGMSKIVRDVSAAVANRRELAQLNQHLEQLVEARTAELDQSLRDQRAILDAVPSMIGYWDSQLRNRVANHAYAKWFGVDPASLKGRPMVDLLGPELFERNRPYVEAALRGEPQTFERAIPRPDGQGVRHSLAHYLPDVIDGEVRGFYVLVHDVTEITESRLKLAAAQRESEALLKTVQEHSLVSVAAPDGRILEVNDRLCQVSGYTREELVGQDHRVFRSGEHGPAFWQEMWDTVSHGRFWHQQVCNRAKDGSLFWVDCLIAPFLGADGRVEKFVCISTDITTRMHGEAELRRTLALLHAVLRASTQVSMVAVDPDGLISVFNRGAELMLGYVADEVIGRASVMQFHDPEELKERARDLGEQLGRKVRSGLALIEPAGLNEPREWTYIRRDGERIPVSLAVTEMRDDRDQLVGYLGVAHDISLRRRYEASLREASERATQASLAKSQFLANMSHEIRTPINAIVGLTYLLEHTPLDDKQRDELKKIRLAGKSLLAIINDVLDLSKIEAGEMSLERAPFLTHDLVSEVAALVKHQAEAKGLRFTLHVAPDTPGVLVGDVTRLRQILLNLAGNAVKFTASGEVSLGVAAVSRSDEEACLRFEVADTGIGIDAAAQARLFKPFTQADVSTTRRFGGTGLGLSIVKQLVELMGGKLELHSVPGQGSRFTVLVTLGREDHAEVLPHGAEVQAAAGRHLAGRRVLVVDDSEINRDVARRVLELEGAQVDTAADGQTAVQFVLSHAAVLDLVLMDVQMPVLDGYAATRRLRALGLRLPIVALTAGATTSEHQRAREAGMDTLITKPIDPPALVRVVARLAAGHAPAETPAADAPGAAKATDTGSAWAGVAGLDAAQALRRLGGDEDLLRSMLRRMLAEFTPESVQRPWAGAEHAAAGAARMHKLKGAAATLGAEQVASLADEVERACQDQDAPRAATISELLAQRLAQLERTTAALVAQDELTQPAANGPVVPLDTGAVRDLMRLLQESDLAALENYRALKQALQSHLDPAAMRGLAESMDALDFPSAASRLTKFVGGE